MKCSFINVQANLTDRPLNEVKQDLEQKIKAANLRCRYEFSGQTATMNTSFKEMILALTMSLWKSIKVTRIMLTAFMLQFIPAKQFMKN